jgi:hypothetical protein
LARTIRIILARAVLASLAAGLAPGFESMSFAQELEPRRWSHLPIGQNFASVVYARTEGDISFDPELGIADATFDLDTVLAGYVRSFELFDASARIEIRQAVQAGEWSGLVAGVPTTVRRSGMSDTFVRLAVNLVGGPPLSGQAYAEHRRSHEVETIVGAAISVQLPTGEYLEDKLINLGSNRFTIRPQLGVQHRRRNWTFEATASMWLHTDNESFFNGNRLSRDAFFSLDGAIIYSFNSGIWLSAAAGVGVGGRSAVNGVANRDSRTDSVWALGIGFPINRWLGLRINYVDSHRWRLIGNESRTLSLGLSASWR